MHRTWPQFKKVFPVYCQGPFKIAQSLPSSSTQWMKLRDSTFIGLKRIIKSKLKR